MKDVDSAAIVGNWFNSAVVVRTSLERDASITRLRNWHRVDRNYSDEDNAGWGYHGTGPYELSYSILRELFGKEVADRDTDALHCNLISRLDKNQGFLLTGAQIRQVLGIRKDGRIARKRIHKYEDPEMAGLGAAIAAKANTGPGGISAYGPDEESLAITDVFKHAFHEAMEEELNNIRWVRDWIKRRTEK